MNDFRADMNPSPEEVNTLRQRLLELEQSHCQCQQQIEQLTQQLSQERTARQQVEERLQLTLTSAQLVGGNVTERQQAEIALRESEERFRVAIERFQLAAKAVNCLIYDWDLKSNRVERTDGLTRLLGYSLEEAEPTGQWWSDRIHPDDLHAIRERSLVALMKDDYFAAEYRVLNKANEYIYVLDQCLVAARDADGNPTRIVGSTTDISEPKRIEGERKRAELQLQESQRFIQQIADSMPGTLYVYDMLEQRNVYVNRQIGDLLGYTPEQIQAYGDQLFAQLIHPEDFANLGVQIERLNQAQDGEVIDHEYRMRHANGEWRWLWSRNTVSTRTPDGLAHQVVGTVHDVTDRKRVEAALAESNQTLQAIIRACPLAIMGLKADGTVRIWNPAAERIFGWSPQEVFGQFLPAIPPDKREEFLSNLAVTMQGQGLTGVEAQRQKKDNTRFDVELWTAPVDETQAGISCVSVVADITARKQTEVALRLNEERLHGFVSSNVIGMLFGDFEGGIQEANDEFLRIVGYTREDLQSGRLRWVDITPPEYTPLEEERIAEARRRGACTPYEKEYIRKDGSRVPVLVGYGLVLAVREEVVAFILDLSDRKQAEAEREQLLKREQTAREQAEVANRVKDEFLAVLSHELRTPLNPILGWTRLLRTRQFDPVATDRALETIERNAKLQAQLIEDLLDVSRILQGKVQLDAAPVNLLNTVEAALETVRLSAEAKGIEIQTLLDSEVGRVNGDANRLQQIVWNLLSNAVKFTPAGGQIQVCLEQIAVESQELEVQENQNSPSPTLAQITVSDTGQGIHPDFLPHVFDYFRQADSSTTRNFGGLGLGLAIVRHLVELHGGTVSAASLGYGMGATFTVQLPLLRRKKTGEIGNGSAIQPRTSRPLHPLTGLRILIVDDEADMRDLIRFILEEQGATVSVAVSAREALQQLTASIADVLISDIGMPEMDGYALIKKIRALNEPGKLLPAIALTAYAGESNQYQALAAGFQLHLAKPIEPEQLVKAITQVMDLEWY